jgi:hypothetical protein
MYLSMTEEDYQNVRTEARLQTALALGIANAQDLSDSDLDMAINRSDPPPMNHCAASWIPISSGGERAWS